jgi:DNA-binding XRE family transcriptional regulator
MVNRRNTTGATRRSLDQIEGARLKLAQARHEAELSQEDMAAALGTTQGSYARLEQGTTKTVKLSTATAVTDLLFNKKYGAGDMPIVRTGHLYATMFAALWL